MLQSLMYWYGKTPPSLRAELRRWVVMPGKRIFSRGEIAQDGFVVAKRLDQSIAFKLWREHCYEPHLSRLFRENLRPGDTFVDVGANIGYFTLLACACVGPRGQVHSFEPNSDTFQALEQNVRLNQFHQATLNNLALTDQSGSVQLWFGPGIDSGLVSMQQTSSLLTEKMVAQATTLDEYISTRGVGKIHAMKLDVEGAELLVLKGAKQLLAGPNRPDLIALELVQSHAAAFGILIASVVEFLSTRAYKTYGLLEQEGKSFCLEPLSAETRLSDGTCIALANPLQPDRLFVK